MIAGKVVVVAGYGHGVMDDDIIIIKYDNDLNEIWSYIYTGDNGVDSAVGLVLDNNDNIYVAGSKEFSSQGGNH